jgi:uncharacterized protein (TIGR02145 family)
MKKTNLSIISFLFLGFLLTFNTGCSKTEDLAVTVTDLDGNVYHTVTIGTQIWMVENLRTTKYNDGTAIPLVTGNTAWTELSSPGYCWYKNDASTYKNTYGALYNWYAVGTGKLAPTGWHIPTDAEWATLITFLGGESIAGNKLKETGTVNWLTSYTSGTNETGFTALPGGYRSPLDGMYGGIGSGGNFWSSTLKVNSIFAYDTFMAYDSPKASKSGNVKEFGQSVRCIRDSQ